MPLAYPVPRQSDRLGVQLLNSIATIVLAHHNGAHASYKPSQLACVPNPTLADPRACASSVFMDVLSTFMQLDNSSLHDDADGRRLSSKRGRPRRPDYLLDTTIAVNQDLFSYFRQHFGDLASARLREGRLREGPLNSVRPEVCLHLRLGDVRAVPPAPAAGFAEGIAHLDSLGDAADAHALDAFPLQSPMLREDLRSMVAGLRRAHPSLKVVVFACDGEGGVAPEDMARDLGADEGRCDADRDTDLLMLATCRVLVAARSSFSLAARFFFEGETFYSPAWSSAVASGLFTERDRSGTRGVEDLLRDGNLLLRPRRRGAPRVELR